MPVRKPYRQSEGAIQLDLRLEGRLDVAEVALLRHGHRGPARAREDDVRPADDHVTVVRGGAAHVHAAAEHRAALQPRGQRDVHPVVDLGLLPEIAGLGDDVGGLAELGRDDVVETAERVAAPARHRGSVGAVMQYGLKLAALSSAVFCCAVKAPNQVRKYPAVSATLCTSSCWTLAPSCQLKLRVHDRWSRRSRTSWRPDSCCRNCGC